MKLKRKDILGIKDLTKSEIEFILETAESFKEISERSIKKVPTLRGKTIINLFMEPSTRTRVSFEIAEKRLSADAVNITSSGSSISKGETLKDMTMNLEAMNPDIIVMRHKASGAPHLIAKYTKASVINAGDGVHEHPSQALLDMLTIRDKLGRIKGLNVVIVGDISHSRVARSDIYGLTKLGANVSICAPSTLIPSEISKLGVKIYNKLEDVLPKADVIIVLRIQLERQGAINFPTLREYARFFGLNKRTIEFTKKDAIIMHPGPINRGVEIDPEIADCGRSVILDQVTNGVAVRMALLYLLSGARNEI